MHFRKVAFLFLVSFAAIGFALAQSPNGTISGLVLDSSHSVIAGAEITVVNDATHAQYLAKTNGEGIYVVPNLPPGSYRIQVAKVGFKTLIKPDITVNVLDALAINFTLPLGALSEIVTVTGGAPLVDTQSASVSTVIDQQFVGNLPLNGRSFNTLLQLTPGVLIVSNSNSGDGGQFSVNGQRATANYFEVDGVSVNFGVGSAHTLNQSGSGAVAAFNSYGGTSSLVSVDAMQEFRVQTSSFAPEYGRTPGGQVSITTRSGTNRFHGRAFDYFRNTVLDANDWFGNAARKPRAPEQQNDFGGVFWGTHLSRQNLFLFLLRRASPPSTASESHTGAVRCSSRGGDPCRSSVLQNPAGDVSPRLGLAWRLGSKTVVRASWGMFYDAPPTNLWFNALSNDGSGRSFNASLSPSSPGAPSFPQPLTTATAPATPSVFTVAPDFKNAYAMTTTIQVSRELSKNDAVTFAYVNTGGRQLQWLHNINLINPLGFLLDGRPVFDPRVNAGTRANPAFNNVSLQDVGASSRYNALEINYEHRFSRGLLVNAGYTYSHTISDAPDVNGFEQNLVYVEDTTNRLRDRGNSYVNRPHALTASTVWSPRVKTDNAVLRRLANDNEVAVLTNISSGDQQNVTANANLNGDPLVTSITRPLNIGRNTVRGPKIVQFDLRYTRTLFTFKERFRTQFLTEATNIFNHPNVTSLNTAGVGVVTTGCPKAANGFTLDPTHCGQLAAGSLPTSFPLSSTVLQGRILDFGLGVRW